MLLLAGILAALSYGTSRKCVLVEGKEIYKTRFVYAILTFLYIIFWIGLRDKVLDTTGYIKMFNAMPTEWNQMIVTVVKAETGNGFYFIQGVFKILISESHYVWLSFLCAVSCFCLLRTLYKYSVDFPLTAFLFIASTEFTWLLNGARQFLAVCILFAFSDWLIERRIIRYMLLVLLMSTIHSSVIFLIPVCLFVSAKKIFDKKMVIFILLTVVGTYFSESVFEIVELGLDKDYTASLEAGSGSNIIRLFVSLVPIMIVILTYKCVKEKATPFVCLAVNMSLVGSCFYFASTFTNGILIGRMPVYFEVYNLCLLPWLIKNCFTRQSRKFMWLACAGIYTIYFYYQMCIAWGGLVYVSDILQINC